MTSPIGSVRDLAARLAGADPARGVTFVDERFREQRLSWREIARGAEETRRLIEASGLGAGQRLLVPMSSSPSSVMGLLGAFLAGAVPLTVAHGARLGQDEGWARRRLEALIARHGLTHVLQPADGSVPEPPRVISRPGRPRDPDPGLALIQFSSGTTHRPKGIELSHDAILTNVQIAGTVDERGPGAVHVTWLPLHHDMGLVGGLLASLPSAHDLVLLDPACFVLKPVSWIDALTRFGATSTAAPNFALAVTCERVPDAQLRRRQVDLSRLRSLYDGAEPVRPLTVRRFEERFREHGLRPGVVRPVYGLAEATLIVTAPAAGNALRTRRAGGLEVPSVGKAVGDFEIRIVRPGPNAEPLPAGETGEILLRGRCLFRGYHEDPEATRAALVDGWLRTGDLGCLDENGELFVTGRLKDLLIVAGRNVHAHEIGDVVDELPFARKGHSHAVAVPRADEGAATDEIVVLLSPALPAARRLRRAADELASAAEAFGPAGETLGRWARGLAAATAARLTGERDPARLRRLLGEIEPEVRLHVQRALGLAIDRVELVGRLPKTSSGKIRREACLEIALERRNRG